MAISFKGAHFAPEAILMGVRWYLAYPLSTRHVEELMEEFHRRKRPVWVSWRMDETSPYKGEWGQGS